MNALFYPLPSKKLRFNHPALSKVTTVTAAITTTTDKQTNKQTNNKQICKCGHA
jgi:hypothetical protein